MIYIYDGSFQGLLTAVFYGYPKFDQVENILSQSDQISFLDQVYLIDTELDKYERVGNYIKAFYGEEIYSYIYYVFLTEKEAREMAIFNLIYQGRRMGRDILFSTDRPIVFFNKCLDNIKKERHGYLGLLRFSQGEDGVLYGEFKPENNILPIIMGHFRSRLGDLPFIIHDSGRNLFGISRDGGLIIEEGLDYEFKQGDRENNYKDLWKTFHRSIGIENKKNLKLQQANMPKKYWKYLIEME